MTTCVLLISVMHRSSSISLPNRQAFVSKIQGGGELIGTALEGKILTQFSGMQTLGLFCFIRLV